MNLKSEIFTLLLVIFIVVVYIVNFVQFIIAITESNLEHIIIKGIGVITALGSLITVWF